MTLLDLAAANPLPASESPSLEAQLDLSKQQKLLYSYLAQLRGLNRNAILGVRSTKQGTAEARQEIDRLLLQLQNLYYEQRHLRGEIAACESYEYDCDTALIDSRGHSLIRTLVATNISSFPLYLSETFLYNIPNMPKMTSMHS